jgi:hypothetical protein
LGIEDITDYLLIEMEEFKSLEYSFYTTGEKGEEPVEQVGARARSLSNNSGRCKVFYNKWFLLIH